MRLLFAIILENEEKQSHSHIVADLKSTRLNSSHGYISYAVFCLKKKKNIVRSLPLTRIPDPESSQHPSPSRPLPKPCTTRHPRNPSTCGTGRLRSGWRLLRQRSR